MPGSARAFWQWPQFVQKFCLRTKELREILDAELDGDPQKQTPHLHMGVCEVGGGPAGWSGYDFAPL